VRSDERLGFIAAFENEAIALVDRHGAAILSLVDALYAAGKFDHDQILDVPRQTPEGRRLVDGSEADSTPATGATGADNVIVFDISCADGTTRHPGLNDSALRAQRPRLTARERLCSAERNGMLAR